MKRYFVAAGCAIIVSLAVSGLRLADADPGQENQRFFKERNYAILLELTGEITPAGREFVIEQISSLPGNPDYDGSIQTVPSAGSIAVNGKSFNFSEFEQGKMSVTVPHEYFGQSKNKVKVWVVSTSGVDLWNDELFVDITAEP